MRPIVALALAGFLGVGAPAGYAAEEEPVYRGKKASEWAAQLQAEKDLTSQHHISLVAGNAVHARGGALFAKQTAQRRIGLVVLQIIGPDKFPAMVPVIVTAVQNDPEAEVRAAAATTLAKMYEKIERGKFAQAREAISLALRRDPSWRVREAAAAALGDIEPEEARSSVLLLAQALGDESPEVVHAAADTLRKLGKDAADAAPALVKLLKDANAAALPRTQAALALGRIGAPDAVQAGAVAALKEAIVSAETPPDLRIACVSGVGFFGKDSADAVPAVGALLGSRATPLDLRRKAVDTLDQLGLDARAAVADLLKAVKDDDKHVRARAVHALSVMAKELGPDLPKVVQAFHEGLSDSAVDVRIAAINACSLLGPESLGDRLGPIAERLGMLGRETQKDVAEAAKLALARLKPQ